MEQVEVTKVKPDYACVFVGKHGDEFSLWQFAWNLGDPPEDADDDNEYTMYFYLAWTDNDGNEYDDIAECEFDEYIVLQKLPTMDEVFNDEWARRKKRYATSNVDNVSPALQTSQPE